MSHQRTPTSFRDRSLHARPPTLWIPWLTCFSLLLVGGLLLGGPRSARAQAGSGFQDTTVLETVNDDTHLLYAPTLNKPRTASPLSLVIFSGTELTQDIDVDIFIIQPAVTAIATTDITIRVREAMTIYGQLLSDCHAITLLGERTLGLLNTPSIHITGIVDNRCSDPTADGPPLTIWSRNGDLSIGAPDEQANIQTSGDLIVANDDADEPWSYLLAPEEIAADPLAPACTVYADTLVDLVTPATPAIFGFTAEGLDPNLGPVQIAWDFGDGTTLPAPAPENIEKEYAASGIYTVTATLTDTTARVCQATLVVVALDGMADFPEVDDDALDDDDEVLEETPPEASEPVQPQGPAVMVEVLDLATPVDESVDLVIGAFDAYYGSDDLTFAIDWGDGSVPQQGTGIITATYAYSDSGIYTITVQVTNPNTHTNTAQGVVYIMPAVEETNDASAATSTGVANLAATHDVCQVPPPGAIFVNQVDINNPPPAGQTARGHGRNGGNRTFRARGDVIIAPGVVISGQDGGDGAPDVGTSLARGRHGGNGGNLTILARGRITICGGVTLRSGDGGDGGNATANADPGQTARAYGGRGGRAASRLWLRAARGIEFAGAGVRMLPGNGGQGGEAVANGGPGEDRCTTGQSGGHARAYGGAGGFASKVARFRGRLIGVANITAEGGLGGNGGRATANGGPGGKAECEDLARGGDGGTALSRGGQGGPARLSGDVRAGFALAVNAFTGGDGGNGIANGGAGGQAIATPSGPCVNTTAIGGRGARATGRGGDGARGRIDGDGGAGTANGGGGGSATATGGDCTPCADGGDASARSGNGGHARASNGRLIQNPALGAANGGAGGAATARGGNGGDCSCDGDGGAGGNASATGARGGNASGGRGIRRAPGQGGSGTANGGTGGDAGDCCLPIPRPAGDGGAGGAATARGGFGGFPQGQRGGSFGGGGVGGNGGDGQGPGSGGAGGPGNGTPNPIPDGQDGEDGEPCPPRVPVGLEVTTVPTQTVVVGTPITVSIRMTDVDGIPMPLDRETFYAMVKVTQNDQPAAPPHPCANPESLICVTVIPVVDAGPGPIVIQVQIFDGSDDPIDLAREVVLSLVFLEQDPDPPET